jgi:predicted transcriptional regulator
MNSLLKSMLPMIEKWSAADQEALVDYAREIEALRSGFYDMTPDEEAAVLEGLAQADRGEFTSAESIAALGKRFGA